MLELEYVTCKTDSLIRIREKGWSNDEYSIMTQNELNQFKNLAHPFHISFKDITNTTLPTYKHD